MDLSSPALEATRLRLTTRFGHQVEAWWSALPERVTRLSRRWELRIGEAVGRGNTSLVLRCTRSDGAPALLKLVPDRHIAAAESQALVAWQSSGRVPEVLGSDRDEGALLMEEIPGETSVADAGAAIPLEDFAGLCRALHTGGPAARLGEFETLGQRVDFMFSRCAERLAATPDAGRTMSPADLERSHRLARRLAEDTSAAVLLHGDLHPGNILLGGPGRGLVAIDPRPCVGDATFDAVDFVFWPAASAPEWSRRRDELSRHLPCDGGRLRDWCSSVAAVLAVGKLARAGTEPDVAALLDIAP